VAAREGPDTGAGAVVTPPKIEHRAHHPIALLNTHEKSRLTAAFALQREGLLRSGRSSGVNHSGGSASHSGSSTSHSGSGGSSSVNGGSSFLLATSGQSGSGDQGNHQERLVHAYNLRQRVNQLPVMEGLCNRRRSHRRHAEQPLEGNGTLEHFHNQPSIIHSYPNARLESE
jgi:hypothetical protein